MTNSKVQADAGKKLPPNAGKGRKAGVPNKVTKQVKDMILGALDEAGGQAYLIQCAHDPKLASAFLTLVGKVLPIDQRIGDPNGNPLQAAQPVFNVTLTRDE